MFSGRCFKENCQNKLFAKCICEENILFCQEHAWEHLLETLSNRHQPAQIFFKPAEEIKQPIIQRVTELKKEVQNYRKETILNASQVIKHFKEILDKYLNQINQIDKGCSKMIEGLLNDEDFLDIATEDDIPFFGLYA